MQIASSTQKLELNGWTYRVRRAQGTDTPRLLLLIHGLKGNEDVMWVFTRHLPKHYWILSPRAPISVESGGFSWVNPANGVNTPIQEFSPVLELLRSFLEHWQAPPNLDKSKFSLMGFSQGAALAYAYILTYPNHIDRLAGLAGFLPVGAEMTLDRHPLQGKHIFMAHGTRDDQVPVENAQRTVKELERAGALVTYCEDDVGHKLSASCLRKLDQYFID